MNLTISLKQGLISILFIFISTLSFSQNKVKGITGQDEKNYSEELFIKTDRDLYIAGEQVWLKVSKFNSLTYEPANMSKVVYVDLLDIYNNPVQQVKIGVDGFSGSGLISLPDTLSTGNYIIRAYTNWLKNFSVDLFSYKKISVINPFKSISGRKISATDLLPDSIIFSPESGRLIVGIESKLGFISYNKRGDPATLTGALIYENNDTLCYLDGATNGYGWVTVKPESTRRIYLVTTNKKGQAKRFALPEIMDEGISVTVTQNSSKSRAFVKIVKSPDFVRQANRLYLQLMSPGFTDTSKELNFGNKDEISLNAKDLPPGISHLSVIDEENNQLAERWIYNKPEDQVNYEINIQNDSPSAREKITLAISAKDNNDIPLVSDFSVSVAKSFTVSKNSFDNMYRQLPQLATIAADINFQNINDYLIMYPGHCRFLNNNSLGSENSPSYLPELEGHLVSGNIRARKTGTPLGNENVTLSFIGKTALCQFTKTNDRGDFHFITKEIGQREIVIQPLSSEIHDTYVELYNPFLSRFNKYNHQSFSIDKNMLPDINNAIISMQIKKIYEPFIKQNLIEKVASENDDFYGEPDNTVLISKYIELTSLKEVVKEIIPGVSTIKKNDKSDFKLVYNYQTTPFENSPLVLVDGVPLYDIDKILNVTSKDIEKIDVLTTRYFIADNVLDGILHFVTRKGDLGVIDFDRSVFRLEYELVQAPHKFYSVEYSTDSLMNSRIPDFRNTLYWNADMHTDKTGNATVEFFSSDESAEYLITIEGFTTDGKKGVASFPLKIQSK